MGKRVAGCIHGKNPHKCPECKALYSSTEPTDPIHDFLRGLGFGVDPPVTRPNVTPPNDWEDPSWHDSNQPWDDPKWYEKYKDQYASCWNVTIPGQLLEMIVSDPTKPLHRHRTPFGNWTYAIRVHVPPNKDVPERVSWKFYSNSGTGD